MKNKVSIAGVGVSGFKALTSDLSYRELVFDAAVKAYLDAGIEHHEIEGFVTTAEDLQEGYSIADEYTPDQLGAVLKPCYTVSGDFLHSIASAAMMIQAGLFDIVAVECLSKASNMLTLPDLAAFAMDPTFNRPLNFSEHVVAGLEMSRFLFETGNTVEQAACVVVQNKANALLNPHACFGAKITVEDVLCSEPVSYPIRRLNVAQSADGAVVIVLASEKAVSRLSCKPIFIKGIGWSTDAPSLESREWGSAEYGYAATQIAYKNAGISCPAKEIQLAEVNDEYGYKELMHIESLGLCRRGESGELYQTGFFAPKGQLPVNVSGGMLGIGNLYDANGGALLSELIIQLRGLAGQRQVQNVKTGVALSWRGVPSSSGVCAVLTNEG